MKILVTGAAGFIGFHLVQALVKRTCTVVGIDNLNDYYDVTLKQARLAELTSHKNFDFRTIDLADRAAMASLFEKEKFDRVIHLGAQAGVRYSIDNPFAYIDSNLVGTMTVLEGCRHSNVKHVLYASSSSVYGANTKIPFSVSDRVDHPVSLYAATKKSNELMSETYARLYGLTLTGLRFFTVYGPWGRPDMAYFKFAQSIVAGKSIPVYNNGDMKRDFTYIDDIVSGILRILDVGPEKLGLGLHKVYNLGNNKPEYLMDMISMLERHMGQEASKDFLPMQPGDVYSTYADIDDSVRDFGYAPNIPLDEGLRRFVDWFKKFYKI
ncbi:UDP-glucuronate 4-epimerase [Comamonas sp. BIGb0124]|uniref:SDR family NAD(P)-dependent oxidoreductase n=1 Tax=Comamonas sp. BIGb0124 TaxID=2485130 RepID=UPI000F4AB037|nr:SDR family NAD(P)-dependent oxidoreductase [Comamonas sp. BIGb0124]ROR18608.1 UDP-glucuronate 4-epimerase [Comamonas sp. BIGb0124]